ncbi:MAG: peptidase domain-containing ABC transporter [Cytophagales bacterium]|nr:peptidase domain-containing ABC transporter [Cytophagales bacterium]
MIRKFPFIQQSDQKNCGPTCIMMVAKYYNLELNRSYIEEISDLKQWGTTLGDLTTALEKLGFKTLTVKITYDDLLNEAPLPAIIPWKGNHFVVVYKVTKQKVYISDPSVGRVVYKRKDFLDNWGDESEGAVLLIESTSELFKVKEPKDVNQVSLKYFFQFLTPQKKLIYQLFLGLLTSSILSLISPFLTQSIVDVGIQKKDIGLINLILIGQVMFFAGNLLINVIRSWILLHITTSLSIAVISDFFRKLMLLPISYFEKKNLGDILQKIEDHSRINQFLTSSSLQTLFSFINIIVFGLVLAYYDFGILTIYFLGSALYITWVLLFWKKRKIVDNERFKQASKIQNNEVEMVLGVSEVKLNQAEKKIISDWESKQLGLFKVRTKTLTLEQLQLVGGSIFNESKNIFITYTAAKKVIEGEMTLGMMMATIQILGLLNGPLQQLIGFIQQAQDAKISLERLRDIHSDEKEETSEDSFNQEIFAADIVLKGVDFQYDRSSSFALKNLNLTIPHGKTTAIVGLSGSGKTTLLKLLLKFYEPNTGTISFGLHDYREIPTAEIRKNFGVVLQEGYIFSDSILNNICISGEQPNLEKFRKVTQLANIDEFINSLPEKANTKIGLEGVNLSAGQKQRIMIARALYKSPKFLLMDEATSSLDSKNEREISENIQKFIKGNTNVIIAHRLSTVRNADNIVVIDQGSIIEQGNHQELINMKGQYYTLVSNQLELT